jgi:hypothetical protein
MYAVTGADPVPSTPTLQIAESIPTAATVNTQHPLYRAMSDRWRRCRDVSAGQDAVHAAGERYLAKLKEQTPEDYNAMVSRATFYNATWRTIAGLVGMIFRKPPQIDSPDEVVELLKDVTMQGQPFQIFLQEVTEEALKMGRLGVLVDYPPVNVVGLTLADAMKMNLRPMMQLYKAESIINWRTGPVNNKTSLTLVVLKENEEVPIDEFKTKVEERFRVLDMIEGKYRVRLKKIVDGKEIQIGPDVYPLMRGAPLDYIPFVFIGTDDATPEVDEPPLIDLVNLNLSHYRTTADLEHAAHFVGLPTPVVTGHRMPNEGDKLYIGSATAWVFQEPEAKAFYLQLGPEGLKALSDLIDDKEQQMAVLGARMLEPRIRGVESAEAVSIHRKGEESMLSSVSQCISLAITISLRWFIDWTGGDSGDAKVELNRDFYPAPMTFQMLTALIGGWQSGAFSDQVLFDNLQAGEIISAEVTLEEEQARKNTAAPKLAPGAPGSGSAVPGDRGTSK